MRYFVSLLLLVIACGCGGSSSSVQTPPVVAVAIAPVSTPTVIAGSAGLALTASVSNDSSSQGVTWSLDKTGCGTLSATTGLAVTYTPPAVLTQTCSVTITATSIASPAKSNSVTITVTPPPITVVLSPSAAQTLDAGVTLPLSATISNDTGNQGVTWSVSGCGSLSAVTSAPPAVNFVAPSSSSLNTSCSAVVTATSVTDKTKSASVTIAVNPVSVSLSPGAAQNIDAGTSLSLSAVVGYDASGQGVVWSMLPPSGCGTISTNSGVSYAAPASSVLSGPCTATVTATSASDKTKSASVAITVNPIGVTLSNGTAQIMDAGLTASLGAVVSYDPSGQGVAWSLLPASGCGAFSSTSATGATYAAPSSSSLTASCKVTVTATSVDDKTKSASVSITVNPLTIVLSPGSAQALDAGLSLAVSATIGHDPSNLGASWSIQPASGCGSLNINGLSVRFAAPASSNLTAPCTATVTATSNNDKSKTASVAITVNPINVALSPIVAQSLNAGSTLALNATVANDPASQGATWSISPAAGCGTLSSGTGFSVQFSAPASSSIAAPCTATVTVASAADKTKAASVSITVTPVAIAISPNTAQSLDAGLNLAVTVGITSDSANLGATWTILPATGCGTLASGTPFSVQFAAPSSSSLSASCTATVTAVAIADRSKSASVSITVTPISISLSPNTSQTVYAGASVAINASVGNDPAAQGATWSLLPASGCGSLLFPAGTSVQYTAPASSSLAAPCTATVTGASASDKTKFASVAITVNPVSVTLSPAASQILDAGVTLAVGANVGNDPSGQGVLWSLLPATGCGTLSPVNSQTPSVNFVTPLSSSLTSPCMATVTATAVGDKTKSASIAVTVNPISVALWSGSSQTLDAGLTLTVIASISNDFATLGATWSLLPASGCGTLASGTPFSVQFAAPSSSSLTAPCTATVTATSLGDKSKYASVAITVYPVSITLSPSTAQTLDAGLSFPISASISNDPTGQGASWSILPASGCGTLSTINSSTPAVNFAAPASSTLTAPCDSTVTAVANGDKSKSASVSITVHPISISVAPNSTQVLAVGRTLSIAATVLYDPAQASALWSLSPATGCGTLSSGAGATVQYTAPAFGAVKSCSATVTASASSDGAKTASVAVSVYTPAPLATWFQGGFEGKKIVVWGNSTVSAATEFFTELASHAGPGQELGGLTVTPVVYNSLGLIDHVGNIYNYGNDAARLSDLFATTKVTGFPFPLPTVCEASPDLLIMRGPIINDVKKGACDLSCAGALIKKALDELEQCSPATAVLLTTENSFLTTDPSNSGWVQPETAAAAQAYTDIIHDAVTAMDGAYENVLVYDIMALEYGQTCQPTSPFMLNQIHPNVAGRIKEADLVLKVIGKQAGQ